MEMKFLGENIHITEDMKEYNNIRKIYNDSALKSAQEFKRIYSEENRNIKAVINNSIEQAEKIWLSSVEKAIKILIDRNIYDINEEVFIQRYYEMAFNEFNSAYENIRLKYVSILGEEERKDYERKYKKETRGRFIGGGFGVSGAAKGIAAAGAANLATGLAHSAVGSIGKMVSSIGASNKANKLYNDQNTIQSLTIGLHNAVFFVHACVIELINEYSDKTIDYMPNYNLSEKHNIVLENILNHSGEKNKLKETLIKGIMTFPYNQDYYKIAIDTFGDPENEVLKLAEFFHIDISEYKDYLVSEYYNSLDLSSESKAKNSKELLEKKLRLLGFNRDKYEYVDIIKKIKDFDLSYRTVNDITFETREEADVAKKELVFIERLTKDINLDDKEIVSCKIEEIRQNCHTKVSEEYINYLDSVLKEILLKDRTAELKIGTESFDIVYDSEDEAILARQRISNLDSMILNINKSSEDVIIKLLNDINNMNNENPQKEYGYYINYIVELLNTTDLELRTVNNKLYDSREEADMVKKNMIHVEEIAISEDLSEEKLNSINKQFESEEIHEDVKNLVKDKIYDAKIIKENAREEKHDTRFGLVFMVVAIISYFFNYSISSQMNSPEILGNKLLLGIDISVDNLGLIDGIKNGLMLLPRLFADSIIIAFKEYIYGFGNGFVASLIWFIVGMFWIPFKHIILFFPRYFVMLFMIFFQKAHILYYLSYIGMTAFTFKVIQLTEFKKKKIER